MKLDGSQSRKHTTIKDKQGNKSDKLPVYTGEDDISGIVEVKL
jgi:vacuolar protein sorting-associated protein 26